MKKLFFIVALIAFISSCKNEQNGELVGVPGRKEWFEVEPHGMLFIPMGSFNMGPNDQDVSFALTATSKTVSIDPFWMDETEITNNEYRQFVYWVRDSLARTILAKTIEDYKIEPSEEGGETYLNWEQEIQWNDPEQMKILQDEGLFLKKDEQYWHRTEFDARRLVYHYFWVDLQQASKRTNRYNFKKDVNGKITGGEYKGNVITVDGQVKPITGRKSFIMEKETAIYPDTLVWMADYTYSYNEPWTKMYFWHPAFDDYPVVGVNWVQASAFCIWRTQFMNNYLQKTGQNFVQDYRLPTEAEWEYAARGGLALSMYPWGGPYTRNNLGCFIANFKPLRGNYVDDGGIRTLAVAQYAPNEYGLYDMAGNVSEWTSNAFNESAYNFTHDLNPDFTYNATDEDKPVLKRKVVRGGSWKDIGYYLQCGTRTFEYQDTAKSYVGFRCVRSYMGRDQSDWNSGMGE